MPLTGFKPTCKNCNSNTSLIWRKDEANEHICASCFAKQESRQDESNESETKSKFSGLKSYRTSRYKSVRSKIIPKGKSRRSVFKSKSVPKIEGIGSSMTTTNFIIHKGQYYQSGDVISVVDTSDHETYYAQCNAFLTNEYCEKFLSFTWLLPIKKLEPGAKFDPLLFYIGPSDELIRDMNCVEFVCHAPAEYFKPEKSIYSTVPNSQGKGYVSVHIS